MIGYKFFIRDKRGVLRSKYGARGGFRWRDDGSWHTCRLRRGQKRHGLCGPGWFHFYPSIRTALLRDPYDAEYLGNCNRPNSAIELWEVEVDGVLFDETPAAEMKNGCTRLRLVRPISLQRLLPWSKWDPSSESWRDFVDRHLPKKYRR